MEDISRDVSKELAHYKVQKRPRESGHWALLFVGDQGEVITIRKFKGLLLLAVFLMVVGVSAAASIYMLYQEPFKENRRLAAELAKRAGQVRSLGEERDLLLTRLGIAESKLKKAKGPDPAIVPAEPEASRPVAPESVEQPPPTAPAGVPEIENARTQLMPPMKPEASLPTLTASEAAPEMKVDVRDFKVSHDPVQKLLNIQFRLKNVNVDAGAVSGRTFVVLKNDRHGAEDILAFPRRVTLVDGKPGQIRRGRYFSISRFNIVKFKDAYDAPPKPFNRATVFVYSGAGDLLLEKRFLIENPFKETAAAETKDALQPAAGPGDDQKRGLPPNSILNN